MSGALPKARPASAPSEAGPASGYAWSPQATELLDHIAEELAREYVRLMQEASKHEVRDERAG
jgi:hypothetical protein